MSAKQATATATAEESTQPGNKPADKVRAGAVIGTIWKNSGQKGAFYSVTFERRYKDGEHWKSATSFSRGELLELARAAYKAYDAIDDLHEESRKA